MRQYTIRQFQTDPTKCLKNGSFKLTRYGKPFAIVIPDRLVAEEITQDNASVNRSQPQITQKKVTFRNEITQQAAVKHSFTTETTQQTQDHWGKCQNPACTWVGELVDGTYKEWSETLGEHICKPAKLCRKCDDMFLQVI